MPEVVPRSYKSADPLYLLAAQSNKVIDRFLVYLTKYTKIFRQTVRSKSYSDRKIDKLLKDI